MRGRGVRNSARTAATGRIFFFYDAATWREAAKAIPGISDVHLRGYEMAVLRSAYGDPEENAVAIYNGTNIEWHMALECGSIQLVARGTPWFVSLGRDDYSIKGYGRKSNVYRQRAEGRNTLVLNPGTGPDQLPFRGKIDRFAGSASDAFAIANLTGAYSGDAERVTRGVRLFNGKTEFLIQDEVIPGGPTEISSFFHTRQHLEISSGGRTALLRDDQGNRLHVEVLSPTSATLLEVPTRMMPTSPQISGQTPNEGVRKLAVHLHSDRKVTITLWMVPLGPDEPLPAIPTLTALDDWALEPSD